MHHPRFRHPFLVLLLAGTTLLFATSCAPRLVVPARPGAPRPGALFPAAAGTLTARAESSTGTVGAAAPPLPPVDSQAWMGRPLHRAPFPTRKVALTLDDGPSVDTSAALAAFEKAGVRATFFWVGDRAPRYHELVRKAAEEGFQIGNHTWDHHEITHVSMETALSEIDRAQVELTKEAGVAPVFARPPVGHYDDTTLRAINGRGLVMALWSVHGQDTGARGRAESPETIARRVVASARGGDIILLHERNPHTVQALPAIIAGLRGKGLEPVTLSELLVR